MNFEEFKKTADMEVVKETEIANLKKVAIEKFEEFFEIMGKSTPLWDSKMKKSVDKFIDDFVQYMKKNGFAVDCEKPQITENDYKTINATYSNKNISLDGLNYEGEHIFLMIGEECVAEFWFDLPKEAPRYRYWKDNITVTGKNIHDFGENINISYKHFVDYYSTKKELQEVIEKVQININHFRNSLKDIDEYNYCIYKFGIDETYNVFQEFIDSI